MKNKKILLMATCLVPAISVVTIGCENNDVNISDEQRKKWVEEEIKKITINPPKINEQGKNVEAKDVTKENIKSYVSNLPSNTKEVNVEIKSIKREGIDSIIVVFTFISGEYKEDYKQIIKGFKIPEIFSDEDYVKEAISNYKRTPIVINEQGKNVEAKDVTEENIKSYVSNFPNDTDKVKITIEKVEKTTNLGEISLTLKFKCNTYSENVVAIVKGFKIPATGLLPSEPTPQKLVKDEIEKLKQNPMAINEEGKKTEAKNVDISNVRTYVSNIPSSTEKVSIEIKSVSQVKNKYDEISIKLVFRSAWQRNNKEYSEEIEQKVNGFKVPLSELKPSFTNITKPTFDVKNPIVGYADKEQILKTKEYNLNGFSDSIRRIEKRLKDQPNKKINVFYNLGYLAVLHKYGMISHLLKVNELAQQNNTKISIHLYIDSSIKGLSPDDFDFSMFTDKNKFSNISYEFVEAPTTKNNEIEQNKLWSKPLYEINKYIKDNNLNTNENSNILIIDDITTLSKSDGYVTGYETTKNLFDVFIPLLEFDEINIIADGTASTSQYSDIKYGTYRKNPWLQYYRNEKEFSNAAILLSQIKRNYKNGHIEYIKEWIYENTRERIDAFLGSLWSASKFEYKNDQANDYIHSLDIPVTYFYQSSVNLVRDINNTTSTQLSLNDSHNEYFDPYNTESLNIIDFFRELNDDSKEVFAKIFKFNSIVEYEKQFENKLNYVIGGGFLNIDEVEGEKPSTEIIDREVKNIIDVYDELKKDNTNEPFTIWFKGHPREVPQYKEAIKNTVDRLLKEDTTKAENVKKSIDFLDVKIPLEYYVMVGLFTPDENKKKKVKVQTGYSTFVLSTLDSSKAKDIVDKIVVDASNNDIHVRFGSFEQSICFPKSKVVVSNKPKIIN